MLPKSSEVDTPTAVSNPAESEENVDPKPIEVDTAAEIRKQSAARVRALLKERTPGVLMNDGVSVRVPSPLTKRGATAAPSPTPPVEPAKVDPKSPEGDPPASEIAEVDPKSSEGDPAASDVAVSSQSIPEASGKRCRS